MSQTIVLYDGTCPLCLAQMRLLRRLDWGHRLTLVPLDDPQTAQWIPVAERAALAGAMHCLAPDGRIFRGARAIRCLAGRVPLLVPLALLLWVPGVMCLAEPGYGWVARHRHALGRWFGCRAVCGISEASERRL